MIPIPEGFEAVTGPKGATDGGATSVEDMNLLELQFLAKAGWTTLATAEVVVDGLQGTDLSTTVLVRDQVHGSCGLMQATQTSINLTHACKTRDVRVRRSLAIVMDSVSVMV